MSSDLLSLLQLGIDVSSYSQSSRYWGLETATLELADGRTVTYVRRRFIPDADRMTTSGQVTVTQGDRLDTISFSTLGDSLLYWRIADANLSLCPAELEEVGRRLRIALPEVG